MPEISSQAHSLSSRVEPFSSASKSQRNLSPEKNRRFWTLSSLHLPVFPLPSFVLLRLASCLHRLHRPCTSLAWLAIPPPTLPRARPAPPQTQSFVFSHPRLSKQPLSVLACRCFVLPGARSRSRLASTFPQRHLDSTPCPTPSRIPRYLHPPSTQTAQPRPPALAFLTAWLAGLYRSSHTPFPLITRRPVHFPSSVLSSAYHHPPTLRHRPRPYSLYSTYIATMPDSSDDDRPLAASNGNGE